MRHIKETYSGKKFSFVDPQPEDVCIEDIAHHLGLLCRWTGACRCFYSVAQHSIWVANHVPEQYMLRGLMHDAGEAYYGDMSTPLKSLLIANDNEFDFICKRIDYVIADALGFTTGMSPEIKRADQVSMSTEWRDLMATDVPCFLPPPDPVTIQPVGPLFATRDFRKLYEVWK